MLTKKMFSVFIALSMALVLSGCVSIPTAEVSVQESVISRYYEKALVQVDDEAAAEYRVYHGRINGDIKEALTGSFLSTFAPPEFGQGYGEGEFLIVKIRVISADEGGSGVAKIKMGARFFDSGGESLGSVVVEGRYELSSLGLGIEFREAIKIAEFKLIFYIIQQFSIEK